MPGDCDVQTVSPSDHGVGGAGGPVLVTVTVWVMVVGGAVVAGPDTVLVMVLTLPCVLTVTVLGARTGAVTVAVTVPYAVLIWVDVVSIVVVDVPADAVVVTVVAGVPDGPAEL